MTLSSRNAARLFFEAHHALGLESLSQSISRMQLISEAFRKLRLLTLAGKNAELLARLLKTTPLHDREQAFLIFLFQHRALRHLPAILSALRALRLKEYGVEEGTLETPHPLSAAEKQRITACFKKATGNALELTETINPALLGGFSVTTEDRRLDASLKRKVQTLRDLVS